jgi:HEAT repeat protein
MTTPSLNLDNALTAIKTYDTGSARGALEPLDEAVRASLNDPRARTDLERKLAALLASAVSLVAKEYLCGKLVLIGSAHSVPILAELLDDPRLRHAAGNALEAIPDSASIKALRQHLSKRQGSPPLGVINSLGTRRDAGSVSALSALLRNPDVQVAEAATAALGKVGTVPAARALLAFLPKAPPSLLREAANACLTCAESMLTRDQKAKAAELYQALTSASQPNHVRLAAQQGLLRTRL